MRKTAITILIVLGLAFLVAGVSVQIYPQWREVPGGVLPLIVAAFLAIPDMIEGIKKVRDIFFPEKKPPAAETRTVNAKTYTEVHGGQIVHNYPQTESPPAPGSAPARSRSHKFIDRGPIMDDLRRALRSGQQAAVVGVGGMGGVGKTELANFLARELEAEQPGSTLWIEVMDRPLEAVHSQMAQALGVTLPPGADAPARAARLRAALIASPKTVFLDDIRRAFGPSLRYCLPPAPCAALLTSRLHELSALPPAACTNAWAAALRRWRTLWHNLKIASKNYVSHLAKTAWKACRPILR